MQNRIRDFRKRRGWTIRDFAQRVGTSEATISRLETNQMALSTDWLARFAAVLETEPTDLLGANEPSQATLIGRVNADGVLDRLRDCHFDFAKPFDGALAVKLAADMGPFSKGDYLIGRRCSAAAATALNGKTCFAVMNADRFVLGRIFPAHPGGHAPYLVPLTVNGDAPPLSELDWVAPIVQRISYYED